MPGMSVLLIGASGALGKPLLDELLRQKRHFSRLAILTASDRASKFDGTGVDIITTSFYDSKTYQGQSCRIRCCSVLTEVLFCVV